MTTPRPADATLGSYYKSESYVSHTDSKKGVINTIYHLVRRHTLKKKVSLVQELNDSKSILDYGAGTGRFLAECQAAGLSIRGAEPDDDAISNVPQEVQDALDSPETILTEDSSYDTITLWHVLEHVPDLNRVLQRLRLKLNKNGRLIVAVPNHTSYDAKFYGAEWAAWDVPRHLWHFSPDSIASLMRANGFEVIETKPMWFDSVYVSLLSEKIKGSGLIGVVRGVVIGLYSNLCNLITRKPRCSSIIYIMKPPEAI